MTAHFTQTWDSPKPTTCITCYNSNKESAPFIWGDAMTVFEFGKQNKDTLLLFLLPLTISFVELKYTAIVVCSIATFSAIQEVFYVITGRECM